MASTGAWLGTEGDGGGRVSAHGAAVHGTAERGYLDSHLGYHLPAVVVRRAAPWRAGEGKARGGGADIGDRSNGGAATAAAAAVPSAMPPPGTARDAVLFVGIIDILQGYNIRKRFERGFKGLVHDFDSISVAPPSL